MALVVRRGQFVIVVTPGDFGKSRPALIVQSDLFLRLPTVLVAPLTSTLRTDSTQFRIDVAPTSENGLREPSQIAIDKMTVINVEKIGSVIGSADETLLTRINRMLAIFLGVV